MLQRLFDIWNILELSPLRRFWFLCQPRIITISLKLLSERKRTFYGCTSLHQPFLMLLQLGRFVHTLNNCWCRHTVDRIRRGLFRNLKCKLPGFQNFPKYTEKCAISDTVVLLYIIRVCTCTLEYPHGIKNGRLITKTSFLIVGVFIHMCFKRNKKTSRFTYNECQPKRNQRLRICTIQYQKLKILSNEKKMGIKWYQPIGFTQSYLCWAF